MADWERLGRYVVSRRVELGYTQRTDFAEATRITARVLSDIENGRRGNFDQVTIAKLEYGLRWATGSVAKVVDGGAPEPRGGLVYDHGPDTAAGYVPTEDAAVVRVLRSDLPDEKKREVIRMLIAEELAAREARLNMANKLIDLLRQDVAPEPS
ncbi:transcriptional regulator with XRE-family HTH domain [Actinoplanes lutulentus]|uniref:Helix-turn-helix protein n=1 Tax=Actinoplanes lutulentus TaxID=1287878 RepID=A0A327YW32_9ACTN|nr:helix-turn-helix transcriptional regulator [Actinoplanes lutulentus]MBB2940478.1 transcriptional regulator with XRE-family HTH domain [Actinoplanes lutulentus]RAK25462.1 helix-turn-helix protein [Actinoplanes lutulentus]